MILTAENAARTFPRVRAGANYFYAVHPVNLEILPGTVTVLMGRSGSGKTTLLNLLSGLLAPSEGKILLDGADLYALDDASLSRLRGEKLGVVPQARSAVDTLTVEENVLLPARLLGKPAPAREAARLLEALEIADLSGAMPRELSGGELRRVALARALAQEPEILFADEPTGDLDDESTGKVLSLLRAFAHEKKKAVFMVTHENGAVKIADRLLRMDAGHCAEAEA